MEICADGTAYYLCRQRGTAGWRWRQEAGHWTLDRAAVPEGAAPVKLEALPAGLQEEVLAFVTRTAAMGSQSWGEEA